MKIVFNIICKNEEPVILRSLKSVEDFVDAYCIYDTGSTDNTKKIIQEFLDNQNLPYEFFEGKFNNFSDARNRVLNQSKDLGEIVYWHDADEYMNLSSEDKKDLKEKVIELFKNGAQSIDTEIIFPDITYDRKSFFLANNFIWKGAIHEYLVAKKPETRFFKVGEITKVTNEGHSHSDPEKSKKYGFILKEEWEKNQNPRDLFYAANSWRDYYLSDKTDKERLIYSNLAAQMYLKRSQIDEGFKEEQYQSLIYCSDLINPDLKLKVLFYCEELSINRIEHLFLIAWDFYEDGCYKSAFNFTKKAVNKWLNNQQHYKLFLNHSIYDWKLWDLHMVLASLNQDKKEYEIAKTFLLLALNNPNITIPEKSLTRIKQNLL